ncbi:MAG: hypothetical protein AAGI52_06675 [Bacteroidota bacterium]
MIIGLTGEPLIARATYGVREVTCEAERFRQRFDGRRSSDIRTERLRPTGTLVLDVTPGRLLGLLSDISPSSWLLTVRTVGENETGTPLEIPVRTTTPLPLTGPLSRTYTDTGEQAVRVEIGWRSLLTYSYEDLGLVEPAIVSE